MAKAYDKKVRPKGISGRRYSAEKDLPLLDKDQSKWAPNYKGPYIVKKAFFGGALLLIIIDGYDLLRPLNSNSVKKYYA